MFQGEGSIDTLRAMGRAALPPSWRFGILQAKHELDTGLARARLWRWERTALASEGDAPLSVAYVGRRDRRWQVCSLLGLRDEPGARDSPNQSAEAALAGDVPWPESLRVPYHLDAVVPLGRSLEDIMAGYDTELRRKLNRQRARAHARRVTDEAEVERLHREMLEPYGFARHGVHAVNPSYAQIKHLALHTGRLDVIYLDGAEVGCHLGSSATHHGKRYWVTLRFGYPQAVFRVPKQLRDANSVTAHLALAWAIENGFDYYSLGMSPARPDGGLLEWKRRRGGELSTMTTTDYFRVRLPSRGRARFLWRAPLFSAHHEHISLHLGAPAGPSDEQIAARYRQMGFGGLSAVRIYCERSRTTSLLRSLGDLYSRYPSRPHLIELPG